MAAWLMGLQAAVWSMPAQATLPPGRLPVELRVAAGTVSMGAVARFRLTLIARASGFSVSPLLQATRGIAFDVRTMDGAPVAPLEPIYPSPPPPPLEPDRLVAITPAASYSVEIDERARTIFPGPGTYWVRAIAFFFDIAARPVRRARLESKAIVVRVTD